MGIYKINKQIGETPLDALKRWQTSQPDLKNQKMAYAGRLDPMAEGELLVLTGETCKQRDTYQLLDKVYEFDVLFGLRTDSQDVLGLAEYDETFIAQQIDTVDLASVVQSFVGEYEQRLPAYSAYRVNGKPLYWWANSGKELPVAWPSRKVTIYTCELRGVTLRTAADIIEPQLAVIANIRGEFRQEEIIAKWKELLPKMDRPLQLATIVAKVSSGTYIRQLACDIADKLGTKAIATRINRLSILSK